MKTLRCAAAFALVACSSPVAGSFVDAGPDAAPVDASLADAGPDAELDAGPWPVFAACDPDGGGGCARGFYCVAEHTDPAWWADLYGHCSMLCDANTLHACQSQGGVCGCPRFVDGGGWPCTDSDRPQGPMACIPGVKP